MKAKAVADSALATPSRVRGRKRKMKEEDDAEEGSGSTKRALKAPFALTGHRHNGVHVQTRLEDGGVPWASDDETVPQKQIAMEQDI